MEREEGWGGGRRGGVEREEGWGGKGGGVGWRRRGWGEEGGGGRGRGVGERGGVERGVERGGVERKVWRWEEGEDGGRKKRKQIDYEIKNVKRPGMKETSSGIASADRGE